MLSWGLSVSLSSLSIYVWGLIIGTHKKKQEVTNKVVFMLVVVGLLQLLDLGISMGIMEYLPNGTGQPMLFMAPGNREHSPVWWMLLIVLAMIELFSEGLTELLLFRVDTSSGGSKRKPQVKPAQKAPRPPKSTRPAPPKRVPARPSPPASHAVYPGRTQRPTPPTPGDVTKG